MNTAFNHAQLFDQARMCFVEHMDIAQKRKDDAAFNLSRGLLAMMEALEQELSQIQSAIRRIDK
jgi:hypothetical protein